VLSILKPTHLAVALDAPGKTFRHEKAEEYKATRAEMPSELVRQSKRIRQVLEAFNMPVFEVLGWEADDVLGTLAKQAKRKHIPVTVVTLDSDLLQLVEAGIDVFMYRPYIKAAPAVTYDLDAVRERYGLAPEQIPDYKGLKGDPSDNIPGVPGVGEKTATKLLQEFGTIEGVYKRIKDVTPEKLRDKLREHEEQARFSKDLATIARDAPIELDIDACRLRRFDRSRVEELFHELEFRSLLPRIPEELGVEAAPAEKPKARKAERVAYRTITRAKDLAALAKAAKAAGRIGLHVENSDANAMRGIPVGIAIATATGEAAYIPVGHQPGLGDEEQLPLEDVVAALRPVLHDAKVEKVTHNGKFAYVVLANHGVEMRGLRFDTMIAAYLLGEGGGAGRPEEGGLALGWLASRRLGSELPDRSSLLGAAGTRKASRLTMDQVDIEAASPVACASADAAARLREVLEPELGEKGMRRLFEEIEMPLVSVLARIERNGVAIDTGALREMSESLAMEVRRSEEDIYASVGHEFNIGSPIQLSHVLFEELRLPKTRRLKTGAYSTDVQALEGLRGLHEIIDHIYEYRELTKLKSTYLDTLPHLVNQRTNRIHTDFNQTGAATGRLSSSNPNLQNIPVRTKLGEQIRRAFIARDTGPDPQLLSADYSQIELRIMAHITGDPGLVEAFRRDEDIHASTASQVFGVPIGDVTPAMRRRAKVFNFGVLYGLSDYGLSVREKIPREEAANFIRTYFEKYPGIKRYVEETVTRVRSLGYAETLFGRRRYIPDINSGNYNVRAAAERAAINMPVQGTAADIIKIAMNRLDAEMRRRGMRSLMTLQVHDELIFECPADELEETRRLCLDIMPKSLRMEVPLKIDTKTGRNWGDMEYGEPSGVEEMA
jgi:DNA polymerase-1